MSKSKSVREPIGIISGRLRKFRRSVFILALKIGMAALAVIPLSYLAYCAWPRTRPKARTTPAPLIGPTSPHADEPSGVDGAAMSQGLRVKNPRRADNVFEASQSSAGRGTIGGGPGKRRAALACGTAREIQLQLISFRVSKSSSETRNGDALSGVRHPEQ